MGRMIQFYSSRNIPGMTYLELESFINSRLAGFTIQIMNLISTGSQYIIEFTDPNTITNETRESQVINAVNALSDPVFIS